MQAARGTSLNPGATEDDTPRKSRLTSRRARCGFLTIAAAAYAVDVITKIWAVERLSGRPDIEVVGTFLTLHLVRNPGAAFSTGTRFTVALTCFALIAACVVCYYGWRARSRMWVLGLGLLLAGVLGNLTDRLLREPGPMRGHVVDFLRLPNWPVFNIADICINVAAGIIVIQAFRGVRVDGTLDREVSSPNESANSDAAGS